MSQELVKEPTAGDLRALAVKYNLDPRTILKEFRSYGTVKGMAGVRARKACADWREKNGVPN